MSYRWSDGEKASDVPASTYVTNLLEWSSNELQKITSVKVRLKAVGNIYVQT